MIRENRYIVLKRDDVMNALTRIEQDSLYMLMKKIENHRDIRGKEPTEYVVVGHDWPMYDETWAKIEQWVDAMEVEADSI